MSLNCPVRKQLNLLDLDIKTIEEYHHQSGFFLHPEVGGWPSVTGMRCGLLAKFRFALRNLFGHNSSPITSWPP